MTEEQAILSTLEDYTRAYSVKDINALMQVFIDDDSICVIGTSADEICVGRAAVRQLFERNFAQAKALHFEWQWRHVIIIGAHATVATSLIIYLEYQGQQMTIPIRWTVTMKKTDRWLWLHHHASSPDASQKENKAYPQSR